jgi:hypothetical protein
MTPGDDELRLEQGGPTWHLWVRLGLAPADPVPLVKRALLFAGLCWLPLLLLSLKDGLATGDAVKIPFLRDPAAYARSLVAVILLVLADRVVSERLRQVVRHFRDAQLLSPGAEDGLRAIIRKARRRVDSVWIEAILFILAVAAAWTAAGQELASDNSSWQGVFGEAGKALTAAGWWNAVVSRTLFQFLLWRWLFRGFVWGALLAGVARLPLRLIATHPDRAAGLGFLSLGQSAFAILVFALSSVLAGVLADDVMYRGTALESLYPTMGAFGVIAVLLVLAPMLAFAPRLARLKREALYQYGALSSRHDAAFHRKWVETPGEPPLGDPDPSSLADLATGYERAKALRPIPIDLPAVAPVIVAAALPMLPVIALKVPLRDILQGLARIVM